MTKGVYKITLKDERRLQKDKERYAEAEREIQRSVDKLANVSGSVMRVVFEGRGRIEQNILVHLTCNKVS